MCICIYIYIYTHVKARRAGDEHLRPGGDAAQPNDNNDNSNNDINFDVDIDIDISVIYHCMTSYDILVCIICIYIYV